MCGGVDDEPKQPTIHNISPHNDRCQRTLRPGNPLLDQSGVGLVGIKGAILPGRDQLRPDARPQRRALVGPNEIVRQVHTRLAPRRLEERVDAHGAPALVRPFFRRDGDGLAGNPLPADVGAVGGELRVLDLPAVLMIEIWGDGGFSGGDSWDFVFRGLG